MQNSKGSDVILTFDDVRSWKREREQAAARILELDKKLAAVAAIMSEDARVEIFGTAQLPGETRAQDARNALSRFVSDFLRREKRLFSVSEVEGVASNAGHAEFINQNSGVVEETLVGLARRGKLRRRGDLFCHPTHEDIAQPHPAVNPDYGAAEYFREIVLNEAVKRQNGMATSDAVAAIKADPRGRQKISANPQYAYSLVGRMLAKGFLTKVDGRLYHPSRVSAKGTVSPRSQSEKAADPERDRAASASESPAGASLLPFAAQAAE